ncbi:MAG: MFS transporter [Propionicimonas sp.]|jgi:MFS family permease
MNLPASTRVLLANQPFVTLLVARTISMLGMAFAPVALAFGVLRLPGADAGTLSLVLLAQTAPNVLFMLVGGVIADRYPRAVVLRWGEFMAGIGFGAIGLMMLSGNAPVWALCLAAALAGIAGAAIYPALTGIIPDLVAVPQRQQANAWLSGGASGARLVGLVAGGAVVIWLGGGWAMVTAGTLYLLAGVLVLGLPRISATLASASESPIRQLVEGWGEFRSRQWLWVAVLQFSVMVMMLQAAHGVFGPVVAETELGGPATWTTFLAAEAVGAVVGVGLAFVWKPGRPIFAAVLMTFSAGVPAILLGVSAPLLPVIAAAFVMGVGFQLFGVWWMTTMQNEVPPESLSRVASYDALGSLMLGPVGLMLAGPATVMLGVHTALIGAGIISLLTTAFALLSPEVRQLRAHARATSQTEIAATA